MFSRLRSESEEHCCMASIETALSWRKAMLIIMSVGCMWSSVCTYLQASPSPLSEAVCACRAIVAVWRCLYAAWSLLKTTLW